MKPIHFSEDAMKPLNVPLPLGFRASGIHAGLKAKGALDLGMLYSDRPAVLAGVVTKNEVRSAPARRTERILAGGKPVRAVVVNTKFANDLTGRQGMKDADDTGLLASRLLHVKPEEVLVHSTGVVGVPIPRPKIFKGVVIATDALTSEGGCDFARAIMTTDLVPKISCRSLHWGGHPSWLAGMVKGSGMIHPNMATMLGYLMTDVSISQALLRPLLKEITDLTFNRLTVDGDTSPSDSVVLLANGASGAKAITKKGAEYKAFREALLAVCTDLSKAVAQDGEGATKLVTVKITGAKNDADAKVAAMAVAKSPLVKTAIFGADPNWGRILVAVGYSGAKVDEYKAKVDIGGYRLYSGGPKAGWSRDKLRKILSEKEVEIRVDLGLGKGASTVWTCDLTYDYVRINGDYTT
jgi:glutamate N-acetyltransferase/amino-acid N-acetyltransferase